MNFLIELVRRLFASTPQFFVYCKWILVSTGVIVQLPVFLASVGLILPVQWAVQYANIVSVAAAVGAFVSQLTVKDIKNLE
jgi:hypothetical protein